MRTTLTLDNDIFIQARSVARAEKRSIGDVISAWARQALTASPTPAAARQSMSDEDARLKARLAELGIATYGNPNNVVVTNEEINRLREELGI